MHDLSEVISDRPLVYWFIFYLLSENVGCMPMHTLLLYTKK